MELGDGRIVVNTRDGGLSCAMHAASGPWCDDLLEALNLRLDAPVVWSHGVTLDPWQPNIKVPIMPSKQLWAIVRLTPMQDASVESITSLRATKWAPNKRDTEPVTLGFISEGEGRMILREMILDWFRPMLDPTQHQCLSMKHTGMKTMKLAEDFRTSDGVITFQHCWLMYHFSECGYCWGGGMRVPAPRFPPDLIPNA